MNEHVGLLQGQPINLLKTICRRAMSQMSLEPPEIPHYYLPKVKHTKRLSQPKEVRSTFNQSTSRDQTLITAIQPKPEVKLPRVDNKLHIQVTESKDPELQLLHFKSVSPMRNIVPVRRKQIQVQMAKDIVNLKLKNRLGAMMLKNKQIEQMKNVQSLIVDMLQQQSYKLDHHFDQLQQELCS